ncbi:MAG: hypothetical protein AMXMBFR58_02370 [Phycisphaerae bacterium]|nr:hypothetical protein [Phycisphaerales bacterium]MCK6475626.1 hypothetical protein [Phycisphaerales bacterium]
MRGSIVRRAAAAFFGLYAGITFMLTHYPQLAIPVPGRPDLVAHMGLFGLWTILCWSCGWFGPVLSEINTWRSLGVSLVYAAVDEASQMVPQIRRVAALDDFGANALGVMAAGALILAVTGLARRGEAGIIRPRGG